MLRCVNFDFKHWLLKDMLHRHISISTVKIRHVKYEQLKSRFRFSLWMFDIPFNIIIISWVYHFIHVTCYTALKKKKSPERIHICVQTSGQGGLTLTGLVKRLSDSSELYVLWRWSVEELRTWRKSAWQWAAYFTIQSVLIALRRRNCVSSVCDHLTGSVQKHIPGPGLM